MLSKLMAEWPNESLREKELVLELKDASKWAHIPLLNCIPLNKLKDKSLVRFRGMVQDMQNPEIYLERYEVYDSNGLKRMQDGKYNDCYVLNEGENVNYESVENLQGERRTLFVVSIPGLNDWVKNYEKECTRENSSQQFSSDTQANGAIDTGRIKKFGNESSVNDNQVHYPPLNKDYLINSPIPESTAKTCMVKIYENFELYPLNAIVDVVGFLSIDPGLEANPNMLSEYENFNEAYAQNPPPCLIPRIHAIAIHNLPHPNPLLDPRLQIVSHDKHSDDINVISTCNNLKKLLTLFLFNDEFAAEYLLCHLISTVYNRLNFESVGKFCLNICGLPENISSDYTRKFYEILQLLLPACHYLPLSLDQMNNTTFVPKKDYETDKLVSGVLQLAPHTHLVLDETKLQQGKLEENGVRGIQHLANLITHQQIKYNFHYYEIEYNSDIPVLILSEGKSVLPSDFLVPLQPSNEINQNMQEILKSADTYLQTKMLDNYRRFLTMAKICDFNIKSESTKMIQTDFVEMRKLNKKSNSNDLHALLVLSRLLAIARGKKALDEESWNLAKRMETERLQRINKLPKSNRKAC